MASRRAASRTISDLLMLPASLSLSPVVCVFLFRSDPARSTKARRDTCAESGSSGAPLWIRTTLTVKMPWLLLDSLLARVPNTCLAL